ncbi:hypothetical protein [Pseudomonas cannabina]|uniref:hypothetical protein n=1 Tax=Pseudomonas cannabina TaxID=86840 RepID=UPI000F00DDBD|nr:hypothetical protein [Pseudomonas cannabina]
MAKVTLPLQTQTLLASTKNETVLLTRNLGFDMTSSKRFYRLEKYEFPDEKLLSYCPDQLRALIGSRLETAQYRVDGLEGITPVMVDYAQDLIEQARDLLLDLGESFTEQQISDLSLLTWPLSVEEQEKHDTYLAKLQVDRDEAYLRLKKIRRQGLDAAEAAMSGLALDSSLTESKVSLVIGRTGHSYFDGRLVTQGPTGLQVLALVQHLHGRGIESAQLRSYSCSEIGHTFETDPIPNWSVEMDLPTQVDVWAYLIKWYEEHLISDVPKVEILWQDSDELRTDWESLYGLWPQSRICSFTDMLDQLERTPPPAVEVTSPLSNAKSAIDNRTQKIWSRWMRFMTQTCSLIRDKNR